MNPRDKKSPHPPGTARQRSQTETRERIIAAAATQFSKHGGDKTTIAAIAREAGVAAGTVYLHFADKDALLGEVMHAALTELKRSLAEAAAARSARSVTEDVRQRTDGLAGFAVQQPFLAAVLFDPAILGTDAGREVLDFLIASQQASLKAGKQKGWLRADLDAPLAARALVGSLVLVLSWWARQLAFGGAAPDRETVAGQLADLRLLGTGAR